MKQAKQLFFVYWIWIEYTIEFYVCVIVISNNNNTCLRSSNNIQLVTNCQVQVYFASRKVVTVDCIYKHYCVKRQVMTMILMILHLLSSIVGYLTLCRCIYYILLRCIDNCCGFARLFTITGAVIKGAIPYAVFFIIHSSQSQLYELLKQDVLIIIILISSFFYLYSFYINIQSAR